MIDPEGSTVSTGVTRALILRRVPYRDADLVVELFTEATGKLALLARSARRSQKRFGGTLEPFHTLRIHFGDRAGSELGTLREASLETPRHRLITSLEAMEVAGKMLGWIRRACPPRTPEPKVWQLTQGLLDRLEQAKSTDHPRASLGEGGLQLLDALGWGLVFDRCVACGKPCAPRRAAWMHAARGGLVCQRCGGARLLLDGPTRGRLERAAMGQWGALEPADVETTIDLAEAALLAHAGLE